MGLAPILLFTASCYRGDGRYYKGPVDVTEEGISCQAWAAQMPHQHNRQPTVYPILHESANYCRNAGGERDRPWCFTSSPKHLWQYCDVRECGK